VGAEEKNQASGERTYGVHLGIPLSRHSEHSQVGRPEGCRSPALRSLRSLPSVPDRRADDNASTSPAYRRLDNPPLTADQPFLLLITDDCLARHFKTILERADLPRFRLYDLRHTAATLALAAGVPPKVVSGQRGHASAAFTLDTYAHVLPHMQDEAARKNPTA